MNRGSAIVIAAVTAGVLIAASAATLAAINSSSRTRASETIAATASAAAQAKQLTPASPATAGGLTYSSEPLPEVTITVADPVAPFAQSPATAQSAVAPTRSAQEATAIALSFAGGKSLGAERVSHQGYDSWAIKISRSDGSVVKGYVDVTSGVAFDWVIISHQAAVAAKPPGSRDDDRGGQGDENEHEGGDDD